MPKEQNKAVFLDRDGVINEERGTYTFLPEDFKIIPGVPEAIRLLKEHGYNIIVITNQSGISQGLYTLEMMEACHQKMERECHFLINDIYFSRWHPSISASLSRKPDSLMLERAMARYNINPATSWMIGDKERDIDSAKKVGLNTVLIHYYKGDTKADLVHENLLEASGEIIASDHPK